MRKIFIFLLIMALGFSINMSSYSIPGVFNYSQSTNETFTINGSEYVLFTYNNVYFLLLNNSEIMTNKTKIYEVLNAYYNSKYRLSQEDVDKLKSYFDEYNRSRNDGQIWKGSEENACRRALLIDKFPCYDNETCYNTSRLFLAIYAIALGTDDIRVIQPMITSFHDASFGTDDELNVIYEDINTINEETASKLEDIKSRIQTLRDYKEDIEGTKFRVPARGTTCNDCYGVCPDLVLNGTALDEAESYIETLESKLGPLVQVNNISEEVYNNTMKLINEKNLSDTQKQYNATFIEYKNQAKDVIAFSNSILSKVNKSSLKELISNISSKEIIIENKIASRNFENMSDLLEEYKSLILSANVSANDLDKNYENALSYSKEAEVYLFMLEGEANNPNDIVSLKLLKQKKKAYDEILNMGNLSSADLDNLLDQYKELINEEKNLMNITETHKSIVDISTLSSKYINSNILALSVVEVPKDLDFSLITAVFLFLGIFAIGFLFFSLLFAVINQFNRILFFISIAFVLLVALGIAGFFYYSSQSHIFSFKDIIYYGLSDGTMNVIIKSSYDMNNTAIMQSCANKIKDNLVANGINATIMYLHSDGCYINDKVECYSHPAIILNYGQNNNITYNGIGKIYMNVTGNYDYYNLCPLADAINEVR